MVEGLTPNRAANSEPVNPSENRDDGLSSGSSNDVWAFSNGVCLVANRAALTLSARLFLSFPLPPVGFQILP